MTGAESATSGLWQLDRLPSLTRPPFRECSRSATSVADRSNAWRRRWERGRSSCPRSTSSCAHLEGALKAWPHRRAPTQERHEMRKLIYAACLLPRSRGRMRPMTTETSFVSSPGPTGTRNRTSPHRRGPGSAAHVLDPAIPIDGRATPSRMRLHRPLPQQPRSSPNEILHRPLPTATQPCSALPSSQGERHHHGGSHR